MFSSSERMESALKDLSIQVRNYFDFLLDKGFDEEQALQLVMAWQTSILASVK